MHDVDPLLDRLDVAVDLFAHVAREFRVVAEFDLERHEPVAVSADALEREQVEASAVIFPAMQACVREVHPELSFAEMNSGPLTHRKRSGAGFFERPRLLEERDVSMPRRSAADEDCTGSRCR